MGPIYLHMSLRDDELLIVIIKASCHKRFLQLVILTLSLSMFSLDGKGVPQTTGSWRMQKQETLPYLMDDTIWVMLGILSWHLYLFHLEILTTTSRNEAREITGVNMLYAFC